MKEILPNIYIGAAEAQAVMCIINIHDITIPLLGNNNKMS